jgi:hypothetical protein
MSVAFLKNFDDSIPIRDILRNTWFNVFAYAAQHPDHMQYTEQFANSPFADLVDREEVEKYFGPIFEVLQRGIDQKIIKNVGFDILGAFIFHPIVKLSNSKLCFDFEPNDSNIETAFTLAWDAIKL